MRILREPGVELVLFQVLAREAERTVPQGQATKEVSGFTSYFNQFIFRERRSKRVPLFCGYDSLAVAKSFQTAQITHVLTHRLWYHLVRYFHGQSGGVSPREKSKKCSEMILTLNLLLFRMAPTASPSKYHASPKHGSLRPTASSSAALLDERADAKVKVEKTRSMRSPLETTNLKQLFKRGQSDKTKG